MAKAYFASRISDNIAKTPEGFLVCLNVPIARTGYQEYLPEEIGVDGNGVVKVYRCPEEVFAPATIASAEAKDITDLHPSQWIDTNNHSSYSKGHGQNVRRGVGADSELLIADLFVKDAVLISKIENGQREVSCGYDCEYVKDGEGYKQTNIRINHIAIVPNGRAGKEVAIRDNKPIEKENETMAKPGILARMFAAFVKDAKPEEIEEAMEAMKGEKESTKDEESTETIKKISDSLSKICDRLDALEKPKEDGCEDALDALEKELDKCCKDKCCDDDEEEKAKEAADAELIAAETLSGNEIPTNPIPGADSALSMLRTMKPIIAGISNPVERKKASDALLASVKGLMPTPTQRAAYSDILKAERAKAEDSASHKADPSALGKEIKEKFHKKPIVVR